MTVGEVISKYCDTHGISFRQFAEKSGLTSGYVSMLVNNRNPKTGKPPVPKIKTYQQIADAMGITINELLAQTESDTPSFYHTIPAGSSKHMQSEQKPSYKGLADAIVEKLMESEDFGILADDELWRMREDMRKNPELRVLYDLQRKATKSELKQMTAFIKAIRSSNEPENDDPS